MGRFDFKYLTFNDTVTFEIYEKVFNKLIADGYHEISARNVDQSYREFSGQYPHMNILTNYFVCNSTHRSECLDQITIEELLGTPKVDSNYTCIPTESEKDLFLERISDEDEYRNLSKGDITWLGSGYYQIDNDGTFVLNKLICPEANRHLRNYKSSNFKVIRMAGAVGLTAPAAPAAPTTRSIPKVYIQCKTGSDEEGKAIIQALINMGGSNEPKIKGTGKHNYYYIKPSGNIGYFHKVPAGYDEYLLTGHQAVPTVPTVEKVCIKSDGSNIMAHAILSYFKSKGVTNKQGFSCRGSFYYHPDSENDLSHSDNIILAGYEVITIPDKFRFQGYGYIHSDETIEHEVAIREYFGRCMDADLKLSIHSGNRYYYIDWDGMFTCAATSPADYREHHTPAPYNPKKFGYIQSDGSTKGGRAIIEYFTEQGGRNETNYDGRGENNFYYLDEFLELKCRSTRPAKRIEIKLGSIIQSPLETTIESFDESPIECGYCRYIDTVKSSFTPNKIYPCRNIKDLEARNNFIDDRGKPNGYSLKNYEKFVVVTEEEYRIQESQIKAGTWGKNPEYYKFIRNAYRGNFITGKIYKCINPLDINKTGSFIDERGKPNGFDSDNYLYFEPSNAIEFEQQEKQQVKSSPTLDILYPEYYKFIGTDNEGDFTTGKIYKCLHPENINQLKSFVDNFGKPNGHGANNSSKFIPSTILAYDAQNSDVESNPVDLECEYWKYVGPDDPNSFTTGKIYKAKYPEDINKEGCFIDNSGRMNGYAPYNREKFEPSTPWEFARQEALDGGSAMHAQAEAVLLMHRGEMPEGKFSHFINQYPDVKPTELVERYMKAWNDPKVLALLNGNTDPIMAFPLNNEKKKVLSTIIPKAPVPSIPKRESTSYKKLDLSSPSNRDDVAPITILPLD